MLFDFLFLFVFVYCFAGDLVGGLQLYHRSCQEERVDWR
jgi:hypothetical protein